MPTSRGFGVARDRANLRIDLWADEDWRKLSMGAQHLYMLILSHSTLNYAGVADWRPGRLAALTSGRTPDDIRRDAQELSGASFIYADEMTEEVLIRSFLRHDGVIKHPRLHVSMAKDYAGISSDDIRAFIAFEAQKLHGENPTLALWEDARVQTILKATARDLKAETQAVAKDIPDPLANPLPKELNSDPKGTSTATATEAKASFFEAEDEEDAGTKERPIPKTWAPTASHIERAKANGIDVIDAAENFRLHALAKGRLAVSWNSAFTTWLKKAPQYTKATTKPAASSPWNKEFYK
jgi:hypothetical protein